MDDQALARRSRALQLLGTIASSKGSELEAEKLFHEARDTAKMLSERNSASTQRLYEYGESVSQIAGLLYKQGKYEAARQSSVEYLDVAKQLNARSNPEPAWQAQLAKAWLRLGMVSSNLLDAKSALEQLGYALALYDRLVEAESRNLTLLKGAGSALEWIAASHYRAGNFEQAITNGQRQVDVYGKALAIDPGNKAIIKDQLIALRTLANIALNFGDSSIAIAKSEQALAIVTTLTDLDPGNSDWKADQAHILLDLGDGYLEVDDFRKIDRYLSRAETLLHELSSANPTLLKWEIDLIRATAMRGRSQIAAGRASEAARTLRALQARLVDLRGKFPNEPALRDRTALANLYRGVALKLVGDPSGAQDAFTSVLATYPADSGRFEMQSATTRGMALYQLGRYAEAYPIMKRVSATGYRRRSFLEGWTNTQAALGKSAPLDKP